MTRIRVKHKLVWRFSSRVRHFVPDNNGVFQSDQETLCRKPRSTCIAIRLSRRYRVISPDSLRHLTGLWKPTLNSKLFFFFPHIPDSWASSFSLKHGCCCRILRVMVWFTQLISIWEYWITHMAVVLLRRNIPHAPAKPPLRGRRGASVIDMVNGDLSALTSERCFFFLPFS